MPALPLKSSNINLEHYQKDAPLNTHQRSRYSFIKRLLSQIPKIGKGLDYGCGLGDITHHMSSYFESIIGVDVTPQRVEWANAHYAPLQFHVCDPKTLDFPDGSFDTVLSSVVINWADDPESYLQNIRKVLVIGGHLVILVRGTDVIRTCLRSLRGGVNKSSSGFKNISPELMTKMLSADFKVIAIDCLYESFSEIPHTPQNLIVEFLKLPFKLFNVPRHAEYYGILAQKVS